MGKWNDRCAIHFSRPPARGGKTMMRTQLLINPQPPAFEHDLKTNDQIKGKTTNMKTYLLSILLSSITISAALAAALDTAKIDEMTGLKGKMNEKEGVYKVTFPRSDVKVVVDGWTMPPFMGLGTWAAFTPTKDGAMVMGDTVLFEDEVNAAMTAALDSGLNVTALHNHF